jgi:outer membrane lipoprotein-sorting protein
MRQVVVATDAAMDAAMDAVMAAVLALAVVGLLLGSPSAAHASPSATGDAAAQPTAATQTWYAQTRVATDFGVVTTHYWSKGALFRAETILAGHPVITIVNGPRYYIYDSVLNKGAAIERNAAAVREDRERGRPFGREFDEIVASGGEKVHDGPARDEGAPYEIYQLTNENGRRRVLVTLSDPPLPFRVETFVRKTGANGTLEYSGWQRGLEINDSFFQPPAAIQLEQVSYRDYTRRAGKEPIGPAPVYYRDLLHGQRPEND